ncbi:hypothetical protein D9619_012434 [Psilocybe cf. subviscida]|uniref:PHD-type domain-containing protein n=1 Tax=Psilocybe cf. subviscida TaxID=2480587 RepID=A0A8H5ARD0_9AGAR|nr:hypothetical protein D9619_012434 [Psilocybe cf. subviscida]
MKEIWRKRKTVGILRTKKGAAPLAISDAHRSRIPESIPHLHQNNGSGAPGEDEADAESSDKSAEEDGEFSEAESDVDADDSDDVSAGEAEGAENCHENEEKGEEAAEKEVSKLELELELEEEAHDRGEDGNGGATNGTKYGVSVVTTVNSKISGSTDTAQHLHAYLTILFHLGATVTGLRAESMVESTVMPSPVPNSASIQVPTSPVQYGRGHRRAVPSKRERDNFSECCDKGVVTPESADSIECQRAGCETRWYHLECIGLEQAPVKWHCDACRQRPSAQRATKKGRR